MRKTVHTSYFVSKKDITEGEELLTTDDSELET